MKAVTFHGKRDVRVDEVPDPVDRGADGRDRPDHLDRDLRLRPAPLRGAGHVHRRGRHPRPRADGHRRGGRPGGDHIKAGDRVVIPFNISCGHCWMCERRLFAQCETTQVREQDKGAALFGYTKLYGQVPGGQAEYLRVPAGALRPDQGARGRLPDERFLFLSDVLPTAWQAVEYAAIPEGGTVAVFGLGPIGQMAPGSRATGGPSRCSAIDLVPERLEMARRHGVETIDLRRARRRRRGAPRDDRRPRPRQRDRRGRDGGARRARRRGRAEASPACCPTRWPRS